MVALMEFHQGVLMAEVTMIEVESEAVHSLGYDEENKELHVRYKRKFRHIENPAISRTYIYLSVPRGLYDAMMKPDVSKGKFLREHIASGQFMLKSTDEEQGEFLAAVRKKEEECEKSSAEAQALIAETQSLLPQERLMEGAKQEFAWEANSTAIDEKVLTVNTAAELLRAERLGEAGL